MNVSPNFSFFGVRKTLPEGEYIALIKEFSTLEKTSKAGKQYFALVADVEVNKEIYHLNLSLNPTEEGSLKKLIKQLSEQTKQSVEEIVGKCTNPAIFFEFAKEKTVKVISTEKGYLDVYPRTPYKQQMNENVDPDSVPF